MRILFGWGVIYRLNGAFGGLNLDFYEKFALFWGLVSFFDLTDTLIHPILTIPFDSSDNFASKWMFRLFFT